MVIIGNKIVENWEDIKQLELELPGYGNYKQQGSVECLGLIFESEEERRDFFIEKLRKKLKDPHFRNIEGFTIGEDEDILALSDPPYYTACPNPFIEDFIKYYGKSYNPETDSYRQEPFSVDVSEGKGDYLQSMHSYHTKVPPKAIAQYILHYSQPGDLVYDPFGGSGMTGLAALLCAKRSVIDPEQKIKDVNWGARIPIVNDLSPAAAFITSVSLNPPDAEQFERQASKLLYEVNNICADDWRFKDQKVEYFVVTEIFLCPSCQSQIISDQVVRMTHSIGAASEFPCPYCNTYVSKAPTKKSKASKLERHLITAYDESLQRPVKQRQEQTTAALILKSSIPIFKVFDKNEVKEVYQNAYILDKWFPTQPLIEGDRLLFKDSCRSYGISHIHHFYTRRQLRYYSELWSGASSQKKYHDRVGLMFFVQSYGLGATRLNRFIPAKNGNEIPGSQVNRYFSGTLYIPSILSEVSPEYLYRNKIQRLVRAFKAIGAEPTRNRLVSVQSATMMSNCPENSIDYIFTDPPFGENLQYSELNQIWEAWLRLYTNRSVEAVIDQVRKRDVFAYGSLMRSSFSEMFRILKPGRWLTLEFHNSFNAVWIAIQEGLFASGFIVADVRVLDKQQDTYKQSRQGLVKQDLIISAYKPTSKLEEGFKLKAGTEEGVWDFVRNHLQQLPVFVSKNDQAEVIAERQNYLLFDRMVAFHVQRGVTVPLSASEFYAGLFQRFSERDGMYFLPEEVADYDKKRMTVREVLQQELLVTDEFSAVQWLKQQLTKKPQTSSELHPQFTREMAGWSKFEKPLELSELLEQNFLRYDGKSVIPNQIVSWLKQSAIHREKIRQIESESQTDTSGLETRDAGLLSAAKDKWYVPDPSKASDLEKLRDRSLLREFEEYRQSKQKTLKVFRLEAVRAGFKKAWQERDYQTIIEVARKVPETVLQEDPKLLMWYDQALTRVGEEE